MECQGHYWFDLLGCLQSIFIALLPALHHYDPIRYVRLLNNNHCSKFYRLIQHFQKFLSMNVLKSHCFNFVNNIASFNSNNSSSSSNNNNNNRNRNSNVLCAVNVSRAFHSTEQRSCLETMPELHRDGWLWHQIVSLSHFFFFFLFRRLRGRAELRHLTLGLLRS